MIKTLKNEIILALKMVLFTGALVVTFIISVSSLETLIEMINR